MGMPFSQTALIQKIKRTTTVKRNVTIFQWYEQQNEHSILKRSPLEDKYIFVILVKQ